MTRTIVLFGFALAFAAGFCGGMLTHREAARPEAGRPPWVQELKLSKDQQAKMDEIWRKLQPGPGADDRFRALRRERDEAVQALLTPQQKQEHEQLLKKFDEQMAALGQERRKAFDAAVEQTKLILNDEQREKYEQMLKEMSQRWQQRDRGGRGPTTQAGDRATTRPANE